LAGKAVAGCGGRFLPVALASQAGLARTLENNKAGMIPALLFMRAAQAWPQAA
jgi:hypothetical protein